MSCPPRLVALVLQASLARHQLKDHFIHEVSSLIRGPPPDVLDYLCDPLYLTVNGEGGDLHLRPINISFSCSHVRAPFLNFQDCFPEYPLHYTFFSLLSSKIFQNV